jgi:transcription-repair coupling factor (superfamily II helicase)
MQQKNACEIIQEKFTSIFDTAAKKSWRRVDIGELPGCSMALAIAHYYQEHQGINLVIAENQQHAMQLKAEIMNFLGDFSKTPSSSLAMDPADKPREDGVFAREDGVFKREGGVFAQDGVNTRYEVSRARDDAACNVYLFPDWETLPFDNFSPHQDLISERLSVLNKITTSVNAIIIIGCNTAMHKICPKSFLTQNVLILETQNKLDLHKFRTNLVDNGYIATIEVMEHGEFTVKGSIIDIYPMGSKLPVRIELFDDTIETLRLFHPDTQQSLEKVTSIKILPAHEFILNPASVSLFRQKFREIFDINPKLCPSYEAVSVGKTIQGIEYYLPLFFEQLQSIFDYLPTNATVFLADLGLTHLENFWQEINKRYQQKKADIIKPVLEPKLGFIEPNTILELVGKFKQLRLSSNKTEHGINANIQAIPKLPIDRKAKVPLYLLKNYLSDANKQYILVVESAGRREVFLELLRNNEIYPKICNSWHDCEDLSLIVAAVSNGAELSNLAIITEASCLGDVHKPQITNIESKTIDPSLMIRNLMELHIGAPVVHLEFGIGRYLGLQILELNNTQNEFLVIAYANDDKIYVPVTNLHVIHRYTGASDDTAPLHKLGTPTWLKEKQKTYTKIHDIATELLHHYALRDAQVSTPHQINLDEYQRFAEGFAFTETQDQMRAIEQIMQDMQSSKPMDRLICGDVGFGKTEVAMRATFISAHRGNQVCVIVPTTLLAEQHFETFKDRFADFPVNIKLFSRFCSSAEIKTTMQDLATGKVDIVIGTHKLLQNNVKFKNLSLLIIDEEHRFGVKQKEAIAKMRNNIDILSMTATPIPRTLNLAMAGMRDISLIATPPAKRLSIKTFWQEKNQENIKEAMWREIMRGGQVFFLHNQVETIENVRQELQKLLPEARINSAHGQMKERDLERVMADFYHNKFNVLVCTTIIETGIDIPTANTIIIDNADNFGLAQLHQLRGRVGRSHHQAYAYLLTKNAKLLSNDANRRLEAIVALEDLGAGFTLAAHDLEIRGAGEILGEDQSGNMETLGFSLFMELLDKTVTDLKAGKTPELHLSLTPPLEIELKISCIIPESYIADVHNRLVFYKRIANAKDDGALDTLQVELIDRFGLLPEEVKNLFNITTLKLRAAPLGITRITGSPKQVKIEFNDAPSINTTMLIKLIQTQSQNYRLQGHKCLIKTLEQPVKWYQEIQDLLKILQQ